MTSSNKILVDDNTTKLFNWIISDKHFLYWIKKVVGDIKPYNIKSLKGWFETKGYIVFLTDDDLYESIENDQIDWSDVDWVMLAEKIGNE